MNNMKVLISALLVIATTMFISTASPQTGSELLEDCTVAKRTLNPTETVSEEEYYQAGKCIGLTQGVFMTMQMYQQVADADLDMLDACLPEEGIATEQAIDLVVRTLEVYPQFKQETDVDVMLASYLKAFPCK